MVDLRDFKNVGQFNWSVHKGGKRNFYARRHIGGSRNKRIFLHEAILGIKGADHINGDGLDCRRKNLRPSSPKLQARAFRRKPIGCSSQFRGVSWASRQEKWRAHIGSKGKRVCLGYFKSEIEAAKAYDIEANRLGFLNEAFNFSSQRRTS